LVWVWFRLVRVEGTSTKTSASSSSRASSAAAAAAVNAAVVSLVEFLLCAGRLVFFFSLGWVGFTDLGIEV